MRSKMTFLILMMLMLVASPVFAQGGAATGMTGNLTTVGLIIGMAIASGLCGLAQGKAAASAVEAAARNPGAAATIQTLMLLGLAFIESLAIFTLMIIIVKG
ncbi:MAG: ATPase [Acidobacteriota bacterium]